MIQSLRSLSPLPKRHLGVASNTSKPPEPDQVELNSERPREFNSRLLALAVLGSAAALAGCTGGAPQAEVKIQSPPKHTWITTQTEIELGKEVTKSVEAQTPLWNNPAAQERLDRVASKLKDASTRHDLEYTFKLLDTPDINAMAVPGGTIYVTRGLMENFSNDGQLSFVIGHEVGHIQARHSVDGLVKAAMRGIPTGPLQVRAWPGVKAIYAMGEQVIQNRYTHAYEFEADQLGQEMLKKAGMNPQDAVDALIRLQELSAHQEGSQFQNKILDSHPLLSLRIARLQANLGQ